jgi:hypothetical protein
MTRWAREKIRWKSHDYRLRNTTVRPGQPMNVPSDSVKRRGVNRRQPPRGFEEVNRGNIDMNELSRFIAAVMGLHQGNSSSRAKTWVLRDASNLNRLQNIRMTGEPDSIVMDGRCSSIMTPFLISGRIGGSQPAMRRRIDFILVPALMMM